LGEPEIPPHRDWLIRVDLPLAPDLGDDLAVERLDDVQFPRAVIRLQFRVNGGGRTREEIEQRQLTAGEQRQQRHTDRQGRSQQGSLALS
jgi:hypothetical protein